MTNEEQTAIDLLERAKAALPSASQAQQIKFAQALFFTNELGIDDAKLRKLVTERYLALPSWFGASANSMQHCSGYVKRERKTLSLPEKLFE